MALFRHIFQSSSNSKTSLQEKQLSKQPKKLNDDEQLYLLEALKKAKKSGLSPLTYIINIDSNPFGHSVGDYIEGSDRMWIDYASQAKIITQLFSQDKSAFTALWEKWENTGPIKKDRYELRPYRYAGPQNINLATKGNEKITLAILQCIELLPENIAKRVLNNAFGINSGCSSDHGQGLFYGFLFMATQHPTLLPQLITLAKGCSWFKAILKKELEGLNQEYCKSELLFLQQFQWTQLINLVKKK